MRVPPPPTIEQVIAAIPSDFKPDHPPTDRLMSVVDAWTAAARFNKDQQEIRATMARDMDLLANLLKRTSVTVTDPELSELVASVLKTYENPPT